MTDDIRPFVEQFNRDGFVVIPPGVIFMAADVARMEQLIDTALPAWSDGVVDPRSNDSRNDPRFDIAVELDGGVQLRGCALRHRFHRGHGSIDRLLDGNYLYGKRATLDVRRWPRELFGFVESTPLRRYVAASLATAEIAFRDGVVAASYPGYTGESRQYHIDTPEFTMSPTRPVRCDRFILTVMVVLGDELPPLHVLPGSHAAYDRVNASVSHAAKRPATENNVDRQVWQEMLPDDLAPRVTVAGPRGSVLLMNGNLVHGAAANPTADRTAKLMVLHFARAADSAVFDRISLDHAGSRHVVKGCRDKQLVAVAFLPGSRLFSRERARRLKSRVSAFVGGGWKLLVGPTYYAMQRKLNRARNKPVHTKMYLNIGAGADWRHPEVICLDHSLPNAEVAVDLNYRTRLPFDDDRFDGVYVSHCLEHLKESQVKWWIDEVLRTLRPGGVFRVTSPDIGGYLDAYDARDASYFDWIRLRAMYRYDSWLRLIVRMFAEPVVDNYDDDEVARLYQTLPRAEFLEYFNSQIERIDDERLLDPSCHKSWWSGEKMCAALVDAGFGSATTVSQSESTCAAFREKRFNRTRPYMSFFTEGVK